MWQHDSSGAKASFSAQGECLDDSDSGTSSGTGIQLSQCNTTAPQQWTPGANWSLKIVGKGLDDPPSNTTNGTPLQLYACCGTNAQALDLPLRPGAPDR